MNTDKHLHFIKSKIEDAGQAIVYKYIDDMHRQPLGIKTKMEMADNGEVIICLQDEFEKKYCDDVFPVELFFYKKGKSFYVTAKGVAQKNMATKEAKVSIRLNEVEYYELDNPHLTTWQKLLKAWTSFQQVFRQDHNMYAPS